MLPQKKHEKGIEGKIRICLGSIIAKSDRLQYNRAEESIRMGIQILEQLKQRPSCADGYLALDELQADSGQTEKALENLKTAEQMFTEMGIAYFLTKTREMMKRL